MVGGAINAGLNHFLAYPIIPPAVYLAGNLSSGIPTDASGNDLQIDGHTAPVSFKQTLELQLVPGKIGTAPGSAPSFINAVQSASALQTYLGNQFKISYPILTADETFPQNYTTATTVQSDGTLSATSSGHIADLDLSVGPQADFSFGPASLSLQALVFDLKASFDKVQTATMTPTNMLTYAFTAPGTSTPMAVNYTLDGQSYSNQTSVTFNPNVDTLQIDYTGVPIKVTPTWNFDVNFTNTFQNYATLGIETHDRRHQRRVEGLGQFWPLRPVPEYLEPGDLRLWVPDDGQLPDRQPNERRAVVRHRGQLAADLAGDPYRRRRSGGKPALCHLVGKSVGRLPDHLPAARHLRREPGGGVAPRRESRHHLSRH